MCLDEELVAGWGYCHEAFFLNGLPDRFSGYFRRCLGLALIVFPQFCCGGIEDACACASGQYYAHVDPFILQFEIQ